jgi:hypothetical protein
VLDLDGDAVDNHDMPKLPIHGLASGAFTRACLALMAAWLIQMSLAQEKPVPPDRKAAGWKSLFDGKTMEGWKVTDFAGHGDARVREGALEIDMGLALSGVQYTNSVPKVNYEIALQAMKRKGSDFFCGLTIPYKEDHCTFICGGWGGGVVGLSSVNGMDAAENETTDYKKFEDQVWYRIVLRVMEDRIQAWIDDKLFLNLSTVDVKIGMRIGEIEQSIPLGVATWMTSSAIKDVQLRTITPTP